MLIDLKLETMRSRILDFAPLAIDLTHLQSREKYTEIHKVHGEYIKIREGMFHIYIELPNGEEIQLPDNVDYDDLLKLLDK